MPSLEIDILNKIKCDNIFKNYPIFIETGTYLGETTFEMEKHFNFVHTIEIKKQFYNNVKKKYNGNKIKFYLGDSSFCLKEICKNINNNSIFFLDGHWSSGNTGRGKKDCPLYEELEVINEIFKYNAIIIIDDCRLFGKGPNKKNAICNWEDINKEKILEILKKRLNNYYFLPSVLDKNDRLILHINKTI